ncbi:MAG: ABC transporter substrate-binding protein [Propionibacteriaceae bacterium]|jgi:peptide/nickel transport system substrate-binding protein|nr:ABC transporter substrate-binding protein [Propionibacteriaceae bacterium]
MRLRRIIAALACLALAACSQPEEELTFPTPSMSAERDAFTIAFATQITNLSINAESGIANFYLAALTSEGLLACDPTGELVPGLAESWQVEGNKWVFQLRPGTLFQDGMAVTPEDVVFSLELALDPQRSPGLVSYIPDYIRSVEATGESEVTVTLDGPHADFGANLTPGGGMTIISKSVYESAAYFGSASDLMVATGPYMVTHFTSDSITLLRSDSYWGGAHGPRLVRIVFIPDEQERLDALRSGSIDVAMSVPLTNASQWTSAGKVVYFSDRSYQGLTLDPTVAPFDDPHVRKAIAYSIDKMRLISEVLDGHGQAATGIDAPAQLAALGGDDTDALVAALPAYPHSLTLALEEMAQSAVPEGFAVQLTYPAGYPEVGEASLVVSACLAQIGISVTVKEIPLEDWLMSVGDGEQGLAWMVYTPTTPIPWEISSWLLNASGPTTNPANWTNKKVAAKMASIDTMTKPRDQLDAVLSATKTALTEAIYVPVYWGETAMALRPGVQADDFDSTTLRTNWVAAFTVK